MIITSMFACPDRIVFRSRVLGACVLLCCGIVSGCNKASEAPAAVRATIGADSVNTGVGTAVPTSALNGYGLAAGRLKQLPAPIDINNDGRADTIVFAVVEDTNIFSQANLQRLQVQTDDEPAATGALKKGDAVMLVYASGKNSVPVAVPIWQATSAQALSPSTPPRDAELILCWPIKAKSAVLLSSEAGSTIIYASDGQYKSESCST